MPPHGTLGTRPDAVTFAKTVSESDVYQFAGLSGDFAPIHVNAEYAAQSAVGERIAHGVLLMALMSTAATAWCAAQGAHTLSYGYDHVRFTKPILFGDTITVTYAKEQERPERQQIVAAVEAHNQHGELVGVASHILWVMP